MPITIPYTFSSGTTISSSQVNSNFSTLGTNALNKSGDTMTGDLLFTDASLDIGKSLATRPRDIFLSRNATIGGTLGVTGQSTLGYTVFNTNSAGVTLLVSPGSGDAVVSIAKSGGDALQLVASGAGASILKNTNNSSLALGTNNLARLTIAAGGDVTSTGNFTMTGTGTQLTLAPTSGSAIMNFTGFGGDTVQINSNAGNSVIKNTSNSSLAFGTNNLARFTLTAAGNLEMVSGSTITMAAGADLILDIPTGRSLLTKVNGTTKQTTDSSGNLTLAGTGTQFTVSPASGNAVVNLLGASGDTVQLVASTAGGSILKNVSNSALLFGTNNTTYVTLSSAGLQRWHAYGGGTLTTDGSGNITAVSDARVKDRIAPLPYGLNEILQLQPVQHGYNDLSGLDREGLYGGFLAQDVETIIPLAVGRDSRGFRTLADRPILAALVTAVQTLHNRVATLES